MTHAQRWAATVLMAFTIVALTVWPLRSRHLFSWDSANYAFAVERIDISQHRPHPPGYLGYVFAARALNPLTGDVNAAFVAWNVIALAIAATLTASLAESAGLSRAAASAAAVLLVTSPLVWFYTSVAEIYVSELLWATAIGYCAHAVVKGRPTAFYYCAVFLACAAVFKMSTMVLMLPVAAYAWHRLAPAARVYSALLLIVLLAVTAAVFVRSQSGYAAFVWQHFTSATASSRLIGPETAGDRMGIALNRNARDTLIALLAALGFVNALGLIVWAALDRQRPPAFDGRLAALWAAPWLLEFVVVHIGKPGYVLPLLPLVCIILAGFYARRGRWALVTLISIQISANVASVTILTPAAARPGPEVRYRDKPLLQRLKSDLQPMTVPTLATLADSDARVDALLAVDRATCRSGEWVAVAGSDPIDWRRAMYYLPLAQVIRLLPDGETPSIGRNGDVADVPPSGTSISSECGLLWMTDTPPPLATAAPGRHVDGVGWIFPSGSGRVTREAVAWTDRK
jgi:hypothetical protein